MKPLLQWTFQVLAVLAVVVAAGMAIGLREYQLREAQVFAVPAHAVTYSDAAQVLERGRYLFETRRCAECHGASGGGRTFAARNGLKLAGPNITRSGVTEKYTPEDWERTIRQGVKPSGRAVFVMPSEDYNRLTDSDVSALASYIRVLPPQSGGQAIVEFPVLVRVLYGFGAIKRAAEKINHSAPPSQPVKAPVNADHGGYVANAWVSCHGQYLSSGRVSGSSPEWPSAANLALGEGSAMVRYEDGETFVTISRSGETHEERPIQTMPFSTLSKLSNVDFLALDVYLRTLAAALWGMTRLACAGACAS